MNYRKYHKDNYTFYKKVAEILEAKYGDCPVVREAKKLAALEEAYYHLSVNKGYEFKPSMIENIFYD